MSIELVTAPSAEPIELADAKSHLYVIGEDYDVYVESLIAAARVVCEARTHQTLMTTTWRQGLDCWPSCGVIELYRPPLQSVESITYVDDSGVEQTLDDSLYTVDTASMPGRVLRAYGATWPSIRTEGVARPITIEFVAGYATADDIPAPFKHAMKLLIGNWFEYRESVSEKSPGPVPMSVATLLASVDHGHYP